MSKGPYTQPQGAPAGLTLTDQIIWERPEEDGLDDYFIEHFDERGWLVPKFTPVFGVRAVGTSASAVTWPPLASDPPPEPSEPAAAQLLHLPPA